MGAGQYLRVRNWEKFQQYKDRDPKWIKLYRSLNRNYEWAQLDEVSRAHLIGIWLLAAELENKIPNDPAWIGAQISAKAKVDIKQLVTTDFLELYDSVQNCTKTYLETETEKETEGKGGSADPPPAKSKVEYSTDFEHAWTAYPKRAGNNDKRRAWRAWQARLKGSGIAWQEKDMIDGVKRYDDFLKATDKLGTEFVMQASTFFGPADPPNWLNDWKPPKKTNGELKKSLRGMKGDELLALAAKYNVGTYGLSTEKLIPLIQRAMDAAENTASVIDTRLT